MIASKSILIISRDEPLQRTRSVILERAGYAVFAALNDRDALGFGTATNSFNLVVLSLMALASPMLQFASLDSCPFSSDDFELLVMFFLCVLGMALVFPHLFKITPVFVLGMLPPLPSVLSATLLLVEEGSDMHVSYIVSAPLRT